MHDLIRRLQSKVLGKSRPRILCEVYPDEKIGEHSYGGLQVVGFGDDTSFSIGKYCSFAADVKLMLGGEHRHDWVTTYPFSEIFAAHSNIDGHPASKGDITIGNDVWVGRESIILSGVTIGDGAVIAARSLVTRDVEPYTIVGGQPAKLIKARFTRGIAERLLQLRWWDWPDDRVQAAVPLLMQEDVLKFVEAAERGDI